MNRQATHHFDPISGFYYEPSGDDEHLSSDVRTIYVFWLFFNEFVML